MCGIAGFFYEKPAADLSDKLRNIVYNLNHRGPDDNGVWVSQGGDVGLGHTRLAIQDVSSSGHQPMESNSKRYWMSFNGEIYNFQEIRIELEKRNWRFRGHSDTEVILAAIDVWGVDDAVEKMEGMFALAIWDHSKKSLILVRDRVGVKPIYYGWSKSGFWFSSEMVPEFKKLFDRQVDLDILSGFFRRHYIGGDKSIYKNVFKVLPGQMVTIDNKALRLKRVYTAQYWDHSHEYAKCQGSQDYKKYSSEELTEEFNEIFSSSIKKRMLSDVPLGAFLSGGIDSSLVVAHMQANSINKVKTFTVGFGNNELSEAIHARKIAKTLGTEHTEIDLTEKEMLELAPMMAGIYGEPFADSSQIPTYLISKVTKEYVTVALSGDGGDELFHGYSYYQSAAKWQPMLEMIPGVVSLILERLSSSSAGTKLIQHFWGYPTYETVHRLLRLLLADKNLWVDNSKYGNGSLIEKLVIGSQKGASITPYASGSMGIRERMALTDLSNFLVDDVLVKVDRASMKNSLEVRAPFCDDYNLLRFAWKVPSQMKIHGNTGKWLLHQALAKFLPRDLFERKKQGFSVPLVDWLRGPLKGWVEDCLQEERVRREGNFNVDIVALIKSNAYEGNLWYAQTLWSLCNFQMWSESEALQ